MRAAAVALLLLALPLASTFRPHNLGLLARTRTLRSAAAAAAGPTEGVGVSVARNVLGGDLECCCADVHGSGIGTGFFRDGHCSTGVNDAGRHTVCVEATAEFLEFSKAIGNDLSTPHPEWQFPGVLPGDQWCLCAQRWVQAAQAGKAPKIYLRATHEKTLDFVTLDVLREYAVDADDAAADEARLNELRARAEAALGSE